MGNSGSKLVKKIVSPLSGYSEQKSEPDNCESVKLATPYVLSRKGSMFLDEDGDLAHEFYVEEPPQKKGAKATMKRVYSNLTPQGEVAYQFPRLHVDFPVILHQS
ncbi:tumor suppressor candidate 2-like [Ischnura elegans]|uniref:tumor suppressor candidate 2-like n=1 Tax=Ischnura elegans TaxID=197161 RepID=UPI001ED89069|nr:tumor suppressor candidate 2-like [Ischnura elegans]XP_046405873.1 tumor suppressor candidate 2-like [Ischnura elegans]XP_046405874.1 tumor suppressor candidate 2-like [Ischnura elegans]